MKTMVSEKNDTTYFSHGILNILKSHETCLVDLEKKNLTQREDQ